MEAISERLLNLRRLWRLSVAEVANKLGVSYNDVESWEDGSSTPSINVISSLCSLYAVSLEYLVTGQKSALDEKTLNRPLSTSEKLEDFRYEWIHKLGEHVYQIYGPFLESHLLDFRNDRIKIGLSDVLALDNFSLFEILSNEQLISMAELNEFNSEEFLLEAFKKYKFKDVRFYRFAMTLNNFNKNDLLDLFSQGILEWDASLILEIIDGGAFVKKCVGYDSVNKKNIYCSDVFFTKLLKEYCEKEKSYS